MGLCAAEEAVTFDDAQTALSRLSGDGALVVADLADHGAGALPDAARRLLAHAITPANTLARRVVLSMSGSIVQGARRLSLTATEQLAPLHGFAWTARARLGPAVVVVRDHYFHDDSRVDVRLFGVIPIGGEAGPDTTASSRGRLAAESIWVPSMLLPQPGIAWSGIDQDKATVTMSIGSSRESVTVTVDERGRLMELAMHRWGNVGVPHHQPIPYGFRVLAERTFDGYTIPSFLEGGWWFGTTRFDPDRASRFVITQAQFS